MRLLGVVEDCWVELYELHVPYFSFGTICHCYAVACGYGWVRRCGIDGSCASCGHECYLAEVGVYFSCVGIEYVCSVADDVRCASCYTYSQVVLCDNFYGEVVFEHFYVGVLPDGFHQSALYLCACVVGMM